MKILVTGVTGLIGRNLVARLLRDGHEIFALARTPNKVFELPRSRVFQWTHQQNLPPEAMQKYDAVVHLAGEGIADKRWSVKRKAQLIESRCEGTRRLVESFAQMPVSMRPQVLISASAIGFYDLNSSQDLFEDTHQGKGFLAALCQRWEQSAKAAEALGIRVVTPRLGIVLAKEGGALPKMGATVLGSGEQWVSWVHLEDVLSFFEFALENEKSSGAYNLTSPNPVTNRVFSQKMKKVLKIPLSTRVPKFVLKIALGELSALILSSQRVLPQKTKSQGFEFKFANLDEALINIYENSSYLDQYYAAQQFVPASQDQVFPFFSRAENLERITPPWLNFRIIKKTTSTIEKGTLIDYQLKVHGFPVRWRTRISLWNPKNSFVDEQLRGPYRKWLHKHTFEIVPGGTLLRDEVVYQVPGFSFGKLLLSSLIRKDVETIFSYRKEKIEQLCASGELQDQVEPTVQLF